MLTLEKLGSSISWLESENFNCHSLVLCAIQAYRHSYAFPVEKSLGAYSVLKDLLETNQENTTTNPYAVRMPLLRGNLVSYHVIKGYSEFEPVHSGLIAGPQHQAVWNYLTANYVVVERQANGSPIFMYPFNRSGGRWDRYPGEKLLFSIW
jgi:hypothetical protein